MAQKKVPVVNACECCGRDFVRTWKRNFRTPNFCPACAAEADQHTPDDDETFARAYDDFDQHDRLS